MNKWVTRHWWSVLILLLTWGLYFVAVFWRMVELRPEGIFVGHVNVWSDWALHIGTVNIFAYKPPTQWFWYHPMYADGQFTYPFFTNFISAMLVRLGLTLPQALIYPSITYAIITILGLYGVYVVIGRSRRQALLSIFIFFLAAGPGILRFLKAFAYNPTWQEWLSPPKHYSVLEQYGWFAGNFIVGMLVPQRAFLLGLTLAVVSLTMILSLLKWGRHLVLVKHRGLLALGGLLAGVLPITHMHSFIALVIMCAWLFLFTFKKWKTWLWYGVPAGLLATTLYLCFVWGGIENPDFMQWHPGYEYKGAWWGWFVMWWEMWGVMMPVALMGFGLVLWRGDRYQKAFALASFTLFALGNLFLFQPISWDNAKIFMWAYLGFSWLATVVITLLLRIPVAGLLAACLVLVALIATGLLEITTLLNTSRNELMMTPQDNIELGLKIREQTYPGAKFLTAPDHNHFVMIWGTRPILMGYTAWVMNFGFLYSQREADMKEMFKGGEVAERLLKKYGVSYVVIGGSERHNFRPNEAYFEARFPVAFQNRENKIYDVREVTGTP